MCEGNIPERIKYLLPLINVLEDNDDPTDPSIGEMPVFFEVFKKRVDGLPIHESVNELYLDRKQLIEWLGKSDNVAHYIVGYLDDIEGLVAYIHR